MAQMTVCHSLAKESGASLSTQNPAMDAPNTSQPRPPYPHAAGGWGSLKSVGLSVLRDPASLSVARALLKQNKPGGFACVSCAWAKPDQPSMAEFCANGAKATAWELTSQRAGADFFAQHTLTELRSWSDHALESTGRLTEPMRYDALSDRYVPIPWEIAIHEIGDALTKQRALDPQATVFYASGRASLETSYMYQLLARLYGNNNLPDSSNMCHESTSVGLLESLGVPVGTVRLTDFAHTDGIFFFGQNVGINSPRMLHQLQEARGRNVPIVTFNPLKEPGLVRFVNPQSPAQLLTPAETTISTQYLQVRNGGDLAAMTGMCKWLIESDDTAQASGAPPVLDHAFIREHTQGFDAFAHYMRQAEWGHIERDSGLPRTALEQAAQTYAHAKSVIAIYGMGLTQHVNGVANVHMVSNLLLLRGNIGRLGAGICPVRGHSNVQGQRTVGITEKPELAPLDQLSKLYAFTPPRQPGLDTVATCQGVLDGSVHAFLGLGGNFLRAIPDTERIGQAWRTLGLTVHIATKLNYTHIVPSQRCYLLPCLGRIEIDAQRTGAQTISIEDSTGHFHPSDGVAQPAAATLRSEAAIVAAIAQACLPHNPRVPWQQWVGDYDLVRDAIESTWPDIFPGFNQRLRDVGGIAKPNAARQRQWNTASGKAQFILPPAQKNEADPDVLRLMTVRSDDQFNTTVYGLDDRFRNVWGTRAVLFMHPHDMAKRGLKEGDLTQITTAINTEHARTLKSLRVVPYDIPQGSVAGYFPECNPLIPLEHHAEKSHVPAAKNIPVRVERSAS